MYDEGDDVYRSVVASGAIEEIPTEELTVNRIEQYGETARPLFELWGEATRDIDVTLYEFHPEDVTGRRIAIDRDESSA